jgi:hypothetical protein
VLRDSRELREVVGEVADKVVELLERHLGEEPSRPVGEAQGRMGG